MVLRGEEGAPPQQFELINTDTQEINQIWKYTADSFFIDSKEMEILLLTYSEGFPDMQPEPEEGVYLVKFDGDYRKITENLIPSSNLKDLRCQVPILFMMKEVCKTELTSSILVQMEMS